MNRHYKYGTILEERPDLIKCLLNRDDSNYHIGSAVKVDWICPNCGSIIRGKSVNKVISRGIPCQICSDGVSRPQKIVSSALIQSGVGFEAEKVFDWSGSKRYDFYLPKYNAIIEVNGSQHYGHGFVDISGFSYSRQMQRDELKYALAKDNGINKYYIINASNTSTQSIIPQVSDILTDINVTPIIDDIKCELDAANSLVYQCSDLWNQGKWTGEISNILGISVVSVITYLKRGTHLGICDYTPLKAHQLSQQGAVGLKQKAVRCIETGEVFTSLANACKRYKISSASNIIRSCNNHKCHAGVTPDGVKLSWEYYITS